MQKPWVFSPNTSEVNIWIAQYRPRWWAMVVTKAARKRSRAAPAPAVPPRVVRRRVTSKQPEADAPVEWRGGDELVVQPSIGDIMQYHWILSENE